MPPINQATLSAGVIAVSVAVAAAIAIYESPELQRMASDLRRRIALALHSLGDGIGGPNGSNDEPLFNRPEDAEGFLQSGEIDADDESRKRQREELLYWNAVKLSKELERQTDENEKMKEKEKMSRSSTSFDDFLHADDTADEKGTYVFNTGADVRDNDGGLVRRRGATEGVRGLNASLYANPFADEHGIDYDDQLGASEIAPEKDEVVSQDDIYSATPRHGTATESRTMSPVPVSLPELVTIDPMPIRSQAATTTATTTTTTTTAPSEPLTDDEYMTAGQEDRNDAYASIQAWAQQQQQAQRENHESSLAFYSPLPVTPAAPLSEADFLSADSDSSDSSDDGELVSAGQLTPTDSASVAGSGVDVARAGIASSSSQDGGAGGGSRYYDVVSEDEDGFPTPAHSWTEVGSVVSESEDGIRAAAAASASRS